MVKILPMPVLKGKTQRSNSSLTDSSACIRHWPCQASDSGATLGSYSDVEDQEVAVE